MALAQEAARIMSEQGIDDYGLAKRKAAERLGATDIAVLPKNTEIEAALAAHHRLFEGDKHSTALSALRRTALQATEAGFEVGTRTTVDVLDARRRLFEAQTNYARSRYDYILNVFQLQFATGTLDRADLEEINASLKERTITR